MSSFNVGSDLVSLSLLGASSMLLTNVSGSTLTYADNNELSNSSTLTVGSSVTLKQQTWLKSASHTAATVTYTYSSGGGGVQVAGDISGSTSDPIVETTDGEPIVNTATFLGFSQIIPPSGDATGATDLSNINTALAGGTNTSFYLNGQYYVNGSILMQSNTTLILADADIFLVASTNKPIIANPSYATSSTPAASNIHVRGIGRALLDYNGANNPEQTTSQYQSCCITFVNVSNFSIENVQCQNANYLAIMMQACSNGWVRDINHVLGGTDKGFLHTDIGCSNIIVDGVTGSGTYTDAVFSLLSVSGSGTTGSSPMTPYAATLSGSARNISQITFSNITLTSSTGLFNLWVDASGTVSDIDIANVHNLYTGATGGEEIQLGPAGYDSVTLASGTASISGLRVKGYTFGGTAHIFLTLDTSASDLQFSNIRANGNVYGLLGNYGAVAASYYPQANRIKFSDVDLPGITSAMSAMVAGWQINDLEFQNVLIGTSSAPLLNHTSDVTGLKLDGVHVNKLNHNPFVSAGNELGVVKNFSYDYLTTNVTALLPASPTFRIEQPFPPLLVADATPVAIRGSQIDCVPGKDPTGGAATTGGRYVADGVSWNLVKSYNTAFRPEQMLYPVLFHYEASNILGLTNGASVAKWPDRFGNNALVQATGGDQPVWNSADTHLNSLPSVSFNGSTTFLQNSLLTPFSAAQGNTLFIVYYITTITAGKYIVDLATTASGSDGIVYYIKTSSNTGLTLGSTSAAGTATLATNTAYIGCAACSSGSTEYVGENKAAFASLTAQTAAGSRAITGLTLGANYNGSADWSAINVAEVFAYGKLVSTGDYATITAALAAKYNITTS